jgi:hypothetical protein
MVLGLQRLEPLHVVADHLPETFAPSVERRLAHPVALGHLGNRCTVGLSKNPNYLLITVSTLLYDALRLDVPLS